MDPAAAAATAAAMAMQPRLYEVPVGIAFVDPSMQQQQHDGRISYDAGDAQQQQAMMHAQAMYQHQFAQHSMPSALLGRKHAPDRRPLRFWQPFNDWWRAELTRLGRRPTSEEIGEWYMEAAERTWGDTKPTLQETRVHAKCLRSLPLVRDYFRNYRAKKKAKGSDGSGYDGEDTADGDTEDGTDNGGSSRRHKPAAKRARLGGATSSHQDTTGAAGAASVQSHGKAAAAVDPAEAAAAATAVTAAGAAGYGGLEMLQLQAYQAHYWDPSMQNDEYTRAMMQQMQQVALYQQLAAQQLGSEAQHALLHQQLQQQGQQEQQGTTDPATAATVAAAAAAVLGGSKPVSTAGGSVVKSEGPHAAAGAATSASGGHPRPPLQGDTATSNAGSHATGQGDATAEEAASHPQESRPASASDSRTPQQEGTPERELLQAGSADVAATAQGTSIAEQQEQEQEQLAPSDEQPQSAQEPLHLAADGVHVQAMDVDEAVPAALQPTATGGTAFTPVPASDLSAEPATAPVSNKEDAELPVDGNADEQQQPLVAALRTSEEPQQSPQALQQQLAKLRQQPVELDLRDSFAKPDAVAVLENIGSAAMLQQRKKAGSSGKPAPTAADLQAALLSSAAAAAAAMHSSTAVSPYVQGSSVAAAAVAAASGGLNLADSPHVGGAVEQDTPHPGSLVPEAVAAAIAPMPVTAVQGQTGVEQQAPTPVAEQARGISIDIDEAELLNDVELGGMNHGELVAHIRRVQQELLSKRELLQRSFDQLRRTQDRLARRERKLAKEQQKCKQYQGAVATWQAAWQAAALPALDAQGAEQAENAGAAEALAMTAVGGEAQGLSELQPGAPAAQAGAGAVGGEQC